MTLDVFFEALDAMECHISPDWLLVWVQDDHSLTLVLFDTGTHSNLFNSKQLRKRK